MGFPLGVLSLQCYLFCASGFPCGPPGQLRRGNRSQMVTKQVQFGSLFVRFAVFMLHIGCRKVKTKATTMIVLKRIERGEFPPARRRTRARTRARVHMSGIPPLAAGPTSSPACARACTKSAIAPLAAGRQPPAFQSFDRLAGWPQTLGLAPGHVDRLESKPREVRPGDSSIYIYVYI